MKMIMAMIIMKIVVVANVEDLAEAVIEAVEVAKEVVVQDIIMLFGTPTKKTRPYHFRLKLSDGYFAHR